MSIEPAASPDHATSFTASAPPPAPPARRIDAVDFLRGGVMVLMVLDHTRDYFGDASVNPTDLSEASPGAVPDTVGDPLRARRLSPSSRERVPTWQAPGAGRGTTWRRSSLRGGCG